MYCFIPRRGGTDPSDAREFLEEDEYPENGSSGADLPGSEDVSLYGLVMGSHKNKDFKLG